MSILFIIEDGINLIMVCLYVNDLIYTGNDEAMFEKFKQSMMLEFNMSDVGMLHYFFVIEVVQSAVGIFLYQKKYVQETLDKFETKNCNSVITLVEMGFEAREGSDRKKELIVLFTRNFSEA